MQTGTYCASSATRDVAAHNISSKRLGVTRLLTRWIGHCDANVAPTSKLTVPLKPLRRLSRPISPMLITGLITDLSLGARPLHRTKPHTIMAGQARPVARLGFTKPATVPQDVVRRPASAWTPHMERVTLSPQGIAKPPSLALLSDLTSCQFSQWHPHRLPDALNIFTKTPSHQWKCSRSSRLGVSKAGPSWNLSQERRGKTLAAAM